MERRSCCSRSHASPTCGATRKTEPTVTLKKEEAVKTEANDGVNVNAMKPAKIEEKVTVVRRSCCSRSHASPICGATRKTEPTVTLKKEEAVKTEANDGANVNAMKPAKIEEKVTVERRSCCSSSHVSPTCGATRKTEPTVTLKKEEAVKTEANDGVNVKEVKVKVGSDATFCK